MDRDRPVRLQGVPPEIGSQAEPLIGPDRSEPVREEGIAFADRARNASTLMRENVCVRH
jgi:hypothetical protein